jgi:hypothetical protein
MQLNDLDCYPPFTRWQKLERQWTYFSSIPEARQRLMHNCVVFGASGEMAALVMTLLYGGKSWLTTASFGFAGAALGAFMGGFFTLKSIKMVTEIDMWGCQATATGVMSKFQTFVRQELKQFVCPYTQELIEHPMKDDKGYVYEKVAIETAQTSLAHLVRGKGDGNLQHPELMYDGLYHVKVVNAIDDLFKGTEIDADVKQGLLAYREAVAKDRLLMVQKIFPEIGKKCLHHKMSVDDFRYVTSEFMDKYRILSLEDQGQQV